MAVLHGILNINDNERTFVNTVGQELVFEAVAELFDRYNAEINEMTSAFVEETTSSYKERYLLPGGGQLQEMGRQAPAAAVKRYNKWDVAYPIRQYGASLGGSRVDMAYLTLGELSAHLKTISNQHSNTVRARILTSLFENDNLTWTDPIHGSLTIRRLANDDGSNFPPIIGSEDEITDDHYRIAGYAVGSISSSNNPVVTLRDEINEHFGGRSQGEDNIVVLHGTDSTSALAGLDSYTAVPDRFLMLGNDTDYPVRLPNVPGRIHGRMDGCWVSEWAWIPDTYMVAIHLDAPPPLKRRVDPADTGLGAGLQLVAVDERHPLESANYEDRFGFGCGNRLSAAVIEVTTDGSYAPPSAYAE